MKFSLLLLIALTLLSFTLKDECKGFRNGTFELNSAEGKKHTIIRKGNKQTEYVEKAKSLSEFDIKWIDDCSYILFNRRILKGEDLYSDSNSDTLYVEVIEIKGNFFKIKSKMKGYNFESESILKKVN